MFAEVTSTCETSRAYPCHRHNHLDVYLFACRHHPAASKPVDLAYFCHMAVAARRESVLWSLHGILVDWEVLVESTLFLSSRSAAPDYIFRYLLCRNVMSQTGHTHLAVYSCPPQHTSQLRGPEDVWNEAAASDGNNCLCREEVDSHVLVPWQREERVDVNRILEERDHNQASEADETWRRCSGMRLLAGSTH